MNGTAEDERYRAILKAVARERIILDGECKPYCCFCPGIRSAIHTDIIHHEMWCPTILARLELKDKKMPLNLYKITYEVQITSPALLCSPRARSENWQQHETHASDYDTIELKKLYAIYRNVKIEKVREL